MEYRLLGNSGIKVSVISYGNWENSSDPQCQNKVNENVKKALDFGINYFDAAGDKINGEGEQLLGVAIKTLNVPREELVISTKLILNQNQNGKLNVNRIGLNRKHIKEGVKNSLKRLQLEYIDIVYCDSFNQETSLEEIARSFTELIQEGLINYWGTSEWQAAHIYELRETCCDKKLVKPITENPQYNILNRYRFEVEYDRLFSVRKMGSTIQNPFGSLVLSDKIKTGDFSNTLLSEKNQFDNIKVKSFKENNVKLTKIQKKLEVFSKELQMTLPQLALCWVIQNKHVSSAILGNLKVENIDEFVDCIQQYKNIKPEMLNRINTILTQIEQQNSELKQLVPFPTKKRCGQSLLQNLKKIFPCF